MEKCHIAIAGLGVVGAETARHLIERQAALSEKAGVPITLSAVSARSKGKDRGFDMSGLTWCDDPVALAALDDIDVIVELMGGSDGPALALTKAALSSGKHVVTANKAMIAHHGVALATLAEENNVQLCFESSVAGGIPALKILREGLAANEVSSVAGILNGTCNYILSEMEDKGLAFDDVLKEAQALGYAEADPTFDVDGIDAAHKLTILDAIAFGNVPHFEKLSISGIRDVTDLDISYAGELGYRIRLIGRATAGGMAKVAPVLLPENAALAKVTGALNAVYYEAEPVNVISAMGPGAGAGPTASAVLSDLLDVAAQRVAYPFGKPVSALKSASAGTADQTKSCYYLRLEVADQSGVLAEVTEVLKSCDISVETLIQKGHETDGSATLVMIVHETDEVAISTASNALSSVTAVHGVSSSFAVMR